MDNSSLNMAHYHSRRADSHLRHLRFEEATDSYRKAAAALDETLALQMATNNAKIIESIKLQRDLQQKNIELVLLKKAQYEKYKLAMEQQRLKNASFLEQRMAKDRIESVCDLQMSIFKTLEESDSLLESLNEKIGTSLFGIHEDNTEGIKVTVENASDVKLKKIKSDNTVIEEMHTLNHQLHILVFNLVSRVDDSSHELEVLRDRVKSLEKDRYHQRKASIPMSNKSSSDSSTKVDESPTENRRGSLTGEERKIILPESSDLPPLELPDFDYNF
ncbi:nuclear receptor-binding factor 2-like [Sitodiplosis mosellana]|uniref:nuclear receptor-binding factor 2-like n=1 Tax=Sitodiplosis mosellana TaxID=263140 RepID=UPI002444D67C|nr:nuclear receptor-binding factor 2-like [Sitodiplosis mosellana]